MARSGAGEASALSGLAASEHDILVRLGAAAVKIWDRLSRERQQELFDAASGDPGEMDVAGLRKKLALILHAHHERTGAPFDPEEDLHAPAGPHAQPHLTNYAATPGSGVLPGPRRGREKGVDPGAG